MLSENVENMVDGAVSKEKVCGQVKEERRIVTSITQRQLKWFEHLIRENSLERLVLEGKIDCSRSRGREKEVVNDLVLRWDAYGRGALPSDSEKRKIQMRGG